MPTLPRKRILTVTGWLTSATLGLFLPAILAIQPAAANTYSFAVPVSGTTGLQTALAPFSSDTGFYNLYIRAEVTADGAGGNIIDPASTEVGGVPPTTFTDAWWYADFQTAGPLLCTAALPCFHFTYDPSDTILALVTSGHDYFNGKTLPNGLTGAQMPDTASFVLTMNSPAPITLGTSFRFVFLAEGYKYCPTCDGGFDTKPQDVTGFLDVTAQRELPEPLPALTGGFGFLLFALAGVRRRRRSS